MSSYHKNFVFLFFLSTVIFSLSVWAEQNNQKWDYSLGSEYGQSAYTPLKKIESEVLYYPFISEEPVIGSPMGSDFHTYILPRTIFGIETLEIEFKEGGLDIRDDTVDIERLVKELEEAVPLMLEDAVGREEESLNEYKYGLRIKVAKSKEVDDSAAKEEENKERLQQELQPEEREIDILVSIIFGQNKIIIKLPPLKDPKDKERLIKELERIAHILARQDELVEINQITD